jgi:lysylphosphatidylglycerol synthetase-like protein (DUF2156 family)
MKTSMVVMIKYAQRVGFILLMLFFLPDIGAAQPQERPPTASADTLVSQTKSNWWFMELEDNRTGTMVKSLLIVICLCTLCLFALLIWILINRNQMQVRESETERLREQFEALLFDYLTSEHND